MIKRLSLFIAAALTLAACTPNTTTSAKEAEQAPPAEALLLPLPDATTPEITAADLAIRIKTLADDTFEGRGPGTPTGEASAAWIAAEMARIGLQPGGDNATFFQEVKMVNQTVDPATSELIVTWPDQDELSLGFKEQAVYWTKRQNANQVSFDPTDVVFVGHGVVAPEFGWNDYAGQDYAGKTVIILVNDPGFATGDETMFKGKAMTYYGRWTYKFEEAARQVQGAGDDALLPLVFHAHVDEHVGLARGEPPLELLEGHLPDAPLHRLQHVRVGLRHGILRALYWNKTHACQTFSARHQALLVLLHR